MRKTTLVFFASRQIEKIVEVDQHLKMHLVTVYATTVRRIFHTQKWRSSKLLLWVNISEYASMGCSVVQCVLNQCLLDMEFLEVLMDGLDRVLLVRGGGREVITIYS